MENNEEIIARLKFIGYIEKNEKINVRHVNKQANTLFTKISRTLLYPDNRTNSLKFVRDVITRTFDIIERLTHNENILSCKSIIIDLTKAKQGMLNLKYTYNEDTKFCCDIDVIIEQISSKLANLKEQHSILFDTRTDTKTDPKTHPISETIPHPISETIPIPEVIPKSKHVCKTDLKPP
jgi:hypothetical protein